MHSYNIFSLNMWAHVRFTSTESGKLGLVMGTFAFLLDFLPLQLLNPFAIASIQRNM